MARVPLAGTRLDPRREATPDAALRLGRLGQLLQGAPPPRPPRARATSAASGRRRPLEPARRCSASLNPGLRVPTLVLDDGRPLGESGAILWYLGDGTEYVPDGPVRPGQGPAVDVLRAVQPRAVRRRLPLLAHEERSRSTRRRSRSASASATSPSTRWRATSPATSSSSAERYSIADIALYAYTHVAHEGGFDLARLPRDRGPGSTASPPSPATSRSRPERPRLGGRHRACRSRPAPGLEPATIQPRLSIGATPGCLAPGWALDDD